MARGCSLEEKAFQADRMTQAKPAQPGLFQQLEQYDYTKRGILMKDDVGEGFMARS